MAKDLASILSATTSFTSVLNGKDVTVRQGELLYADDPIVRKWPEFFGPTKVRERHGDVEQATAAPGEKRGA